MQTNALENLVFDYRRFLASRIEEVKEERNNYINMLTRPAIIEEVEFYDNKIIRLEKELSSVDETIKREIGLPF